MADDWIADLRADLDKDLGHKPRVATLATVGVDGSAQARSVVVRRIDDTSGAMTFTTDWRAGKAAEVIANPSATLLFWLPTLRRQYRVAGLIAVLSADDLTVAEQWRAASDNARAMFAWPPPGQPRAADAAFAAAVPADAPVPDTFAVMVLSVATVERLDLTQSPHLRQRWAGGDDPQTVNP